jgi:hypothetical protein
MHRRQKRIFMRLSDFFGHTLADEQPPARAKLASFTDVWKRELNRESPE